MAATAHPELLNLIQFSSIAVFFWISIHRNSISFCWEKVSKL